MSAVKSATTAVAPVKAVKPLGGLHAWIVWSLATIFVVYLFSVQTGYSVVNPSIQKDLGLTGGQVGKIAATYTWVFAICQFFGGALLDRLGARKVLSASIALVTLGVFVFANAENYAMLLASQFIMALGACTGFVGAGFVGGKWFGMAAFSFMFGLVQFVSSFTSAFTQNLIEFALGFMHWRPLFNWVGVAGVILLAAGVIYIRDPEPVDRGNSAGFVDFIKSIFRQLLDVAKIGHVWIAAIIGAALFGTMLAGGVVWMPKLLAVQGLSPSMATFGASMLWLGLAVGSVVVIRWSDYIQRRKLPIMLGVVGQIVTLGVLLYFAHIGMAFALVMCFTFGFCNAAHMLTFSTTADVVKPQQIGTSSAIVNGLMFIAGGFLINAPASRVVSAQAAGDTALNVAQYAAYPLLAALLLALILSFFMKETYPKTRSV